MLPVGCCHSTGPPTNGSLVNNAEGIPTGTHHGLNGYLPWRPSHGVPPEGLPCWYTSSGLGISGLPFAGTVAASRRKRDIPTHAVAHSGMTMSSCPSLRMLLQTNKRAKKRVSSNGSCTLRADLSDSAQDASRWAVHRSSHVGTRREARDELLEQARPATPELQP